MNQSITLPGLKMQSAAPCQLDQRRQRRWFAEIPWRAPGIFVEQQYHVIMFPAFFLAKLPTPEITQAGCMHTLIGTSFFPLVSLNFGFQGCKKTRNHR